MSKKFQLNAYIPSYLVNHSIKREDQRKNMIGGYSAIPGFQYSSQDSQEKIKFLTKSAEKTCNLIPLLDEVYYAFMHIHTNNQNKGSIFFDNPKIDFSKNSCSFFNDNQSLLPTANRDLYIGDECKTHMIYNMFNAFHDLPIKDKIISLNRTGSIEDDLTAGIDNQKALINSLKTLHNKYPNINGINLDYEPLHQISPEQLIQLSKIIKNEMGDNFKISFPFVVNSSSIRGFGKENWQELAKYIDRFNIMGYDIHGYFDHSYNPYTGLMTQLYKADHAEAYSIDSAVELLNSYGINYPQMSLGLASYGRGVSTVAGKGLKQKFDTAHMGDLGNGACTYEWINYVLENNLYQVEQHDVTVKKDNKDVIIGSYINLLDPESKGLSFISYDSPASISSKIDYAYNKGMTGVFFWALNMDSDIANNSLIKTAHDKIIEF
ncbi:MAG: glycoside hydrolase family 18 protein [Anaplasmataceae bacterium]|nr:glycoside hydrolase family 18 protein [Anaplasmataceae bacterium]